MLLLDTSAISAVMHHVPGAVDRLRQTEPRLVVLCSPVAAEIHYGLANLVPESKRRRILEKEYQLIRKVVRWVDWNEEAAFEFGRIKAALRTKGAPIEDLDVAIASIAMNLEATVATRNARHFERIDGLKIENWETLLRSSAADVRPTP